MSFIMKKHLPRRTFLRGVGAVVRRLGGLRRLDRRSAGLLLGSKWQPAEGHPCCRDAREKSRVGLERFHVDGLRSPRYGLAESAICRWGHLFPMSP